MPQSQVRADRNEVSWRAVHSHSYKWCIRNIKDAVNEKVKREKQLAMQVNPCKALWSHISPIGCAVLPGLTKQEKLTIDF